MKTKRKVKKKVMISPAMTSPFDPLGSWTGNYLTGVYELPVQDVDDL